MKLMCLSCPVLRWSILSLAALLWVSTAWAELAIPDLRSRVTDQTATLDAGSVAALEARLAQLEADKGSQVAVLLVPTTQPETIEQYAIRVAESWKLGRKDVDDGALLLVAKDDRAVRIEVGYGLEGAITDIQAKRIVEEEIVPRFRQGDFSGGIEAGVGRLIGLIRGESLPEPSARQAGVSGATVEDFLPLVMLFAFVGGGLLRTLFGRFPGALLAGGIGFVAAWWLLGTALIALIFAIFIFIMTLASGRGGVSRGGGGSSGGGGWSSGGGGFSGGGGGFGGGGASGRW